MFSVCNWLHYPSFKIKGDQIFWNYNGPSGSGRSTYTGVCACGQPPLSFAGCTGRLERTTDCKKSRRKSSLQSQEDAEEEEEEEEEEEQQEEQQEEEHESKQQPPSNIRKDTDKNSKEEASEESASPLPSPPEGSIPTPINVPLLQPPLPETKEPEAAETQGMMRV